MGAVTPDLPQEEHSKVVYPSRGVTEGAMKHVSSPRPHTYAGPQNNMLGERSEKTEGMDRTIPFRSFI